MAYWIWYPGDFEIYHGMCQNFDREERGYFWPAFWKIDNCRPAVKFTKEVYVEKKTSFTVHAQGRGYVALCGLEEREAGAVHDEPKFPLGEKITCSPGKYRIEIAVGNPSGLPCVIIDGEEICTDGTWMAEDMASAPVRAGYSEWFRSPDQNPQVIEYESEIVEPVAEEQTEEGTLFDFGREMTAETLIRFFPAVGNESGVEVQEDCGGNALKVQARADSRRITLCYGESREEALDQQWCYQKQTLYEGEPDSDFGKWEKDGIYRTKKRAFRYIFVPAEASDEMPGKVSGERSDGISGGTPGNAADGQVEIRADFRYIDMPKRSSFRYGDPLLEKIWNVAENTFRLSSGVFFLDGIKRDRWIWSGDAYQSYMISQYLFADPDICKRTMLALRGRDPVVQHINTILDYSLYWIMGVGDCYEIYGDREFVEMVYPKMVSLMDYCMEQTEEHGFIYGRKEDWVFIDWSDIDIGADKIISGEQMLLICCYRIMCKVGQLLGGDVEKYEKRLQVLQKNLDLYFWDKDQGAYIDSYSTGKKKVSRQSNIFAVIFDLADEEKKRSIEKNVLKNDRITPITTPYFKFWELEALAKLGNYSMVLDEIKAYWGAMIGKGADTFWEEYDPEVEGVEQYAMYGDRFGKSLCHAWGAGPVYLLARYFFGLAPAEPGYKSFVIAPVRELAENFDVVFPVGSGSVEMIKKGGSLTVRTDRDGGLLEYGGKQYLLESGSEITVDAAGNTADSSEDE